MAFCATAHQPWRSSQWTSRTHPASGAHQREIDVSQQLPPERRYTLHSLHWWSLLFWWISIWNSSSFTIFSVHLGLNVWKESFLLILLIHRLNPGGGLRQWHGVAVSQWTKNDVGWWPRDLEGRLWHGLGRRSAVQGAGCDVQGGFRYEKWKMKTYGKILHTHCSRETRNHDRCKMYVRCC